MTEYCSTVPWPTHCVHALGNILTTGDRDAAQSWMNHHLDGSDLAWDAFAVAVAALGTHMQHQLPTTATAALGGSIIFAPARDESLTAAERDAELIVSMTLNSDYSGIAGVMAALRDRGEVQDCVGALMAYATVILQLETRLVGGL
ncbi:hypothetical protein DEU34_3077 [Microbacterium sp. AG1240]|uniref:hypothetical protein n=1 Tax=Microbacterium sp. AG1240 TaxID=2183992 RepID=UPI000EB4B787|nr:hypothetical protein [Microbacterium sp. AG1240]RKT31140.1 hypothetical protein DEU34_3077 [Microbacterium sp. AG1240]